MTRRTNPFDSDSDHDGSEDGAEALAGTDPTNRASRLGFEQVNVLGANNGVVLRWQSVTGRFYRLERGTNLASSQPFGFLVRTNIPASAPMNTETDKTTVGRGPWYYRIKLE